MEESNRRAVQSLFKLNGFQVKRDALNLLVNHVVKLGNAVQPTDFAQSVVGALQNMPLSSSAIDEEIMNNVISRLEHRRLRVNDMYVIESARQLPKFAYDVERKRFVEKKGIRVIGYADDKAQLFKDRFHLVYQRLLNHDLFTEELTSQTDKRKYLIRSVGSLCAESGSLQNCVIVGMVSQLKEDKFYLEDMTGEIELDLNDAKFQPGIYVESSVVMVEGYCRDMKLHATAVGFPPIELAEQTLKVHDNLMGSVEKLDRFDCFELSQLESQNENTMFILLSDVHLDCPKVIRALLRLFTGFSILDTDQVIFFVFVGEFLSNYYGTENARKLREGFKALAGVVSSYDELAHNARFVFVPSTCDLPNTDLLPRPPLTDSVVEPFRRKVTHCTLATNPCHIRYLTQRIVIFRDDIVEKMCRNCFFMPSDLSTVPEHFSKTILAQGHLTPLPLHMSQVYWGMDHALYLYPVPDLVVCCDRYRPFTVKTAGCIVTNPGSFARDRFVFQVYIPSSRTIEDSVIAEDQLVGL